PVNNLFNMPQAINAAGQTVGYGFNYAGNMRPFAWQQGDLAPLIHPAAHRSFATGINNAGRVVGAGYILNTSGEITRSRAIKWTAGVPHDLGTLGGQHAVALAINNANDMVVGFSSTPTGQVKGFLYANNTMTALPGLPGASECYPYDISDTKFIVGAAVVGPSTRAFRLRNGAIEELSMPAGARAAAAYGTNIFGAAVGTFEIDLNTGAHAAVLWRANGQRVDMGNLGGPIPYAVARDINNQGQAVGKSLGADGDFAAFLWQAGQLYNLQDHLAPGFAGTRLLSASAINDHGVIAGTARIEGREMAVVLTPTVVPTQAFSPPITSLPE
ncbi:MAG: hypothetical protein WD749_01290, partial [Phycisphaerales bacterium]